jgi:hypothetical protein
MFKALLAIEVELRTMAADFLAGSLPKCLHSNISRPQGREGAITCSCLDCGQEMTYDWTTMRATPKRKRRPVPTQSVQEVLGGGRIYQDAEMAAHGDQTGIQPRAAIRTRNLPDLRREETAVYVL